MDQLQYTELGYQQITGLNNAKSLTVPENAVYAVIQAQDKDVRWRSDGTDPSATVGMILYAGQDIPYTGNLRKFRAIEVSASAILNVTYYGRF
jgi:hypothetical protein